MVQAVINISKHTNQVLNVVKARYDLKNKSEAINMVTKLYEGEVMEPEIRPEYVQKIKRLEKEKTIKVKSFSKRYGLK